MLRLTGEYAMHQLIHVFISFLFVTNSVAFSASFSTSKFGVGVDYSSFSGNDFALVDLYTTDSYYSELATNHERYLSSSISISLSELRSYIAMHKSG